MNTIQFTVPAVPVPMPRIRTAIRGNHAMAYNPTTIGKGFDKRPHPILHFKNAVAEAAAKAYSGAPLDCKLRLTLTFIMPRPANMQWKKKPMPREYDDRNNGDWENLGKGFCDALNKRLYVDDRQIVSATVDKWIAAGDEQPRVEAVFELLEAVGEALRPLAAADNP